MDALDIRMGLQSLILRAPAGGTFHSAVTEAQARNEFTLQLEEDGTIYTVTITAGGALARQALRGRPRLARPRPYGSRFTGTERLT